jgi:nitroreductase
MDFAKLVKSRHSIRSYLDKPVGREKIAACLEAARLAPSASNTQPWHFVVVDDPALKQKLCDAAFSGLFSTMRFPHEAPVLVAAVASPTPARMQAGNTFLRTNFGLIDMGIGVEHFVLQAAELGLGTCWMGLFNEGNVKKTLGIPRSHKVVVMLTLGYFDPSLAERPHYRQTLEHMSSFNGWEKGTK